MSSQVSKDRCTLLHAEVPSVYDTGYMPYNKQNVTTRQLAFIAADKQ